MFDGSRFPGRSGDLQKRTQVPLTAVIFTEVMAFFSAESPRDCFPSLRESTYESVLFLQTASSSHGSECPENESGARHPFLRSNL